MKLFRRTSVRLGTLSVGIALACFLNIPVLEAQDIGASIIEHANQAALGSTTGSERSTISHRDTVEMVHSMIQGIIAISPGRERGEYASKTFRNIREVAAPQNIDNFAKSTQNFAKDLDKHMNHEITKAIEKQMTDNEGFKVTSSNEDNKGRELKNDEKDKGDKYTEKIAKFDDELTKDSSKLSFNKENSLNKGRGKTTVASNSSKDSSKDSSSKDATPAAVEKDSSSKDSSKDKDKDGKSK